MQALTGELLQIWSAHLCPQQRWADSLAGMSVLGWSDGRAVDAEFIGALSVLMFRASLQDLAYASQDGCIRHQFGVAVSFFLGIFRYQTP